MRWRKSTVHKCARIHWLFHNIPQSMGPAKSKNDTPMFATDQLVWVLTGGKHEEPGTIAEIGGGSDASAGEGEFLVRLHVSAYKLVCDASQLRPMEDQVCNPTDGPRVTRHSQLERPIITPSPKNLPTRGKILEEDSKPAAKRKQSGKRNISVLEEVTSDHESSDDIKVAQDSKPAAKGKQSGKRNLSVLKDATSHPEPSDKVEANGQRAKRAKKSDSSVAKGSVPAVPVKQSVQSAVPVQNDNDVGEHESGNESVDPEDRPFTIEYAASKRSTCRRCNESILKGSLRVSHVPLFRGKPGYRVYRHLECAIFSEEIEQAEDVGGWKKLKQEDYEALVIRVEESKLEVQKENEEIEPDELVQKAFQGEMRTAVDMIAPLLPFQVEGHSWMYHQEVHVPTIRGGILADEMGMGKTIQTLATILDNRPILQHCKPGTKHLSTLPDFELRKREEALWVESAKDWRHEMEMNNVSKKILPKFGATRAGTLVVCPLIALSQWKTEIEKFSRPGCLNVGLYHGPNRASEMRPEMLQKYDIILTTYQVLEQDFRKMVSPNKVKCPNCRASLKIDKLRVHLTYFCGAAAKRTEAQARQRRGSNRDRPGSSGRDEGKSKKSPMTKGPKVMKKAASASKQKKAVIQESDSDLSIPDASTVLVQKDGKRPSRVSGKSASKKLSASVNQWGRDGVNSGDDSDFESASEPSDEDLSSSDDERISGLRLRDTQQSSNRIETARRRQAEALANSKRKSAGKRATKVQVKKLPQKKFQGEKGDNSSEDESSDESRGDPMDGIDLDKLMDEAMAGSRCSLLHSFCWWRVVLDEAHFIKSRSSQTAAAAFALTSVCRWGLSGTPIHNRVGELYSLLRFLRLDPMAYYECRSSCGGTKCDCKSIHYRMQNGRCLDCGHPSMMHYSVFNRLILNPIQRDGYSGDGRRAMFLLRDSVLNTCLLRRTKQNRSADMNLPPRLVRIRSVRLHPVEEDFYEALYTQTKSSFDDYVAEGTLLNNYAHIFDLLTKMRQAVDHPYLIVHSKMSSVRQAGQQAASVANGTTECAMCHEPPTGRIVSSCCSGAFCRSCVIEYLTGAGGENTPCPSCAAPFSIDLNQASAEEVVDEGTLSVPTSRIGAQQSLAGVPSLKEMSHVHTGSILRRINLAEFATSTKIEVLVEELIEMRRERPGSKALVFSQFVNMLDLIRWRLHSDPCLADLGLGVRILHGGMDVKSRDAALKDFREDSNCRVLLMSLKAAGVALNLTVASEVILMDLWWNPAAELQAIDRTHRLGQHRPIRATRLVAEGTVEERVLQLQEKKRLVFDGTIGRDAGSLKMLTVDDMKALFA